ncbi:trypsin-like serine protease, partial [Neoconidiobolus thromboides FSU 785]
RIVGGVKANKSEFPWLVSIGNQYSGHMCGGTLIHEKVVLTAAHCISDKYEMEDLYIGYGKNDLDGVDGEEYKVLKTIKHGNYSEKGIELLDDIGIFILKEEVKDGKIVPKISDIEENYKDESFIVAGWGHTKFEGQMSNSLLKVSLKIIDTKTCKKTWPSLDEKFSICAGTKEGGKDACQGDSGGPLMKSDEDGQYSIVGVVSNGIKCAEPGVPGTYAKVRSYLPWIQKTM